MSGSFDREGSTVGALLWRELQACRQSPFCDALERLRRLCIRLDIGVVESIADEVTVMRAGALVEQGPSERVMGAPQQDYTGELLAAAPRIGRTT